MIQSARRVHEVLLLVLGAEGSQEVHLLLQRKGGGREIEAFVHALRSPDQRPAHEALRPGEVITLKLGIFSDLLIETGASRGAETNDLDGLGRGGT